jgi:hypothetical protein
VLLPAAEAPDSEAKSKLLSVPNAWWSLLGWLGGGLESKTGLKSSRPEREMVAKSSSAEPSLASSRPSKSSSRSSKAPLEVLVLVAVGGRLAELARAAAVGCETAAAEPKISSTLERLRLLRLAWAVGARAGVSLRRRVLTLADERHYDNNAKKE